MNSPLQGCRSFALKIAIFNSLGFCFALASTTYADARLLSHKIFGPRIYTYGYLLCLLAVPIFVATYRCLRSERPLLTSVLVPSLTIFVCGVIALFGFLPEFPHGNITVWVILYALASAIAIWIRYTPIPEDLPTAPSIPSSFKMDRLKEHVTLWRSISISITFGYIGLLFPWVNFIWEFPKHIVDTPTEVYLAGSVSVVALTIFSIYILAGVVSESFRKASTVADLMLKVTKDS
jgi:hypothetical protein